MKGVRIVNLLSTLVLLAIVVFAAVFLYRDYQQLEHMQQRQAALERRLAAMETEAANRADRIAKLQGDSEYIERMLRERLNFVRSDEMVFRFE